MCKEEKNKKRIQTRVMRKRNVSWTRKGVKNPAIEPAGGMEFKVMVSVKGQNTGQEKRKNLRGKKKKMGPM